MGVERDTARSRASEHESCDEEGERGRGRGGEGEEREKWTEIHSGRHWASEKAAGNGGNTPSTHPPPKHSFHPTPLPPSTPNIPAKPPSPLPSAAPPPPTHTSTNWNRIWLQVPASEASLGSEEAAGDGGDTPSHLPTHPPTQLPTPCARPTPHTPDVRAATAYLIFEIWTGGRGAGGGRDTARSRADANTNHVMKSEREAEGEGDGEGGEKSELN